MTPLVIALCLAVAFALGWAAHWVHEQFPSRRPLPPATTRQLRRAARANRPDVREVRSGFGDGLNLRPRARDDFDFGEETE